MLFVIGTCVEEILANVYKQQVNNTHKYVLFSWERCIDLFKISLNIIAYDTHQPVTIRQNNITDWLSVQEYTLLIYK